MWISASKTVFEFLGGFGIWHSKMICWIKYSSVLFLTSNESCYQVEWEYQFDIANISLHVIMQFRLQYFIVEISSCRIVPDVIRRTMCLPSVILASSNITFKCILLDLRTMKLFLHLWFHEFSHSIEKACKPYNFLAQDYNYLNWRTQTMNSCQICGQNSSIKVQQMRHKMAEFPGHLKSAQRKCWILVKLYWECCACGQRQYHHQHHCSAIPWIYPLN